MNNKVVFGVLCSVLFLISSPFVLAEVVNGSVPVGNSAPVVDLVDAPASVSLAESQLDNKFNVTCQYTDLNGYGDIDTSDSYMWCYQGANDIYNETFDTATLFATNINSTTRSYEVEVDNVPYYTSASSDVGAYTCLCYIEDSANTNDNGTDTFTMNDLLASDVNVSSVSFGNILSGSSGTTSVFKVENTGNVQMNSDWAGTNFTSGGNIIDVTNCNITDGVTTLSLTGSAQNFDNLPKYDIGTEYYNPWFSLYVPIGTPTGTYTNVFTHSISKHGP